MAGRRKKVPLGPDWLRAVCTALPSTTEDLKWGADICFSVGDKLYCAMGVDSEGYGFKCEPHVQQALIEREDIEYAKYVGKHGWVTVRTWDALERDEAERLIAWSYRLVLAKMSKKRQRELNPELAAEIEAAKGG